MKKLIANGGNSFCEAIENMKNNDLSIDLSRSKCEYVIGPADKSEIDESDEDEYSKWLFTGDVGGTIVFSTDVNSKMLSENKFKDWILKKYRTFKNRNFSRRILDKIRRKNNINSWTIGRYLIGVYTGDNGKTYNENSLCLNVAGVSREMLFEIAEEVKDIFDQESVVVHDALTKQIYFVK